MLLLDQVYFLDFKGRIVINSNRLLFYWFITSDGGQNCAACFGQRLGFDYFTSLFNVVRVLRPRERSSFDRSLYFFYYLVDLSNLFIEIVPFLQQTKGHFSLYLVLCTAHKFSALWEVRLLLICHALQHKVACPLAQGPACNHLSLRTQVTLYSDVVVVRFL